MNGEVKSYRLNSPMLWSEFKGMPDDIQVLYIKGLREKYGAPTTKLAEMFGASQPTVSQKIVALGIGTGRNNVLKFDKDGWNKFVNGNCDDSSEDPAEVMQEAEPEAAAEQPEFAFEVPRSGVMTFVCPASSALDSVAQILGDTTVKIAISWEWVKDEDRVIDIG